MIVVRSQLFYSNINRPLIPLIICRRACAPIESIKNTLYSLYMSGKSVENNNIIFCKSETESELSWITGNWIDYIVFTLNDKIGCEIYLKLVKLLNYSDLSVY